jgi:hypothetical protein
MTRRSRWIVWLLALIALPISGCWLHVVTNPLIYNESYWEHAHCVTAAQLALDEYAANNNGVYPAHPNGYGDALLLLPANLDYALTGPGYSEAPFKQARASGQSLPESECGRVYIQGLSRAMKSKIDPILLYDKLPTPGGDHCHLIMRCWAPLGREVVYMRQGHRFIPESQWPAIAREQIAMLVELGWTQEQAEACYRD